MNQTIEQSIKEVGTIKIIKLSERKVRLDYVADIFCQEKVIDSVKMKVRYQLDEGIYRMYYPKVGFLTKISNFFRVKMKFIHYGTLSPHSDDFFELDGLKFNNLIKSLYITDEIWFKEWNREKKLKELLK